MKILRMSSSLDFVQVLVRPILRRGLADVDEVVATDPRARRSSTRLSSAGRFSIGACRGRKGCRAITRKTFGRRKCPSEAPCPGGQCSCGRCSTPGRHRCTGLAFLAQRSWARRSWSQNALLYVTHITMRSVASISPKHRFMYVYMHYT